MSQVQSRSRVGDGSSVVGVRKATPPQSPSTRNVQPKPSPQKIATTVTKPSSNTASTVANKPTSNTKVSAPTAQKPTSATRPATTATRPATTTTNRVTTGARPATTAVKPSTTTTRPATTGARPATTAVKPATATSTPATTTSKPATAAKQPAAAAKPNPTSVKGNSPQQSSTITAPSPARTVTKQGSPATNTPTKTPQVNNQVKPNPAPAAKQVKPNTAAARQQQPAAKPSPKPVGSAPDVSAKNLSRPIDSSWRNPSPQYGRGPGATDYVESFDQVPQVHRQVTPNTRHYTESTTGYYDSDGNYGGDRRQYAYPPSLGISRGCSSTSWLNVNDNARPRGNMNQNARPQDYDVSSSVKGSQDEAYSPADWARLEESESLVNFGELSEALPSIENISLGSGYSSQEIAGNEERHFYKFPPRVFMEELLSRTKILPSISEENI